MEISRVGAGVSGDTSNVFDTSTLFTNTPPCAIVYSLKTNPATDPIPTFLSIDANTGVVTVDVTGTPDYSLTSASKILVEALGGEPDPADPSLIVAQVPVTVGLTIQLADCNTNQGLTGVSEETFSVSYTAGTDKNSYKFDETNEYRTMQFSSYTPCRTGSGATLDFNNGACPDSTESCAYYGDRISSDRDSPADKHLGGAGCIKS
jgi:hypothetical protein